MIKLNDYLELFPIPDSITATKIAREEFINVLEDGVPYHSFTLKEFLDVCVRLEAELLKPLKKKIARAIKEHDDLGGKRKRHKKPKSHHKRRHALDKRHQRKCKKKFCDYH
eukprot:5449925-Ditylum_brightwellii.AAC.1